MSILQRSAAQGASFALSRTAHAQSLQDIKASIETRLSTLEEASHGCMRDGVLFAPLPPTNKNISLWYVVMLLALLVVAVWVPYDIALLEPSVDTVVGITLFIFNRVLDLIFMLDMILQFHICYKDKWGQLIREPRRIRKHYLRGAFLLDFISVVPFEILTLMYSSAATASLKGFKVVRMLRLAKLLRLMRSNRVIQSFESKRELSYADIQLLAFCTMLLLFCHWLACGWILLVDVEDNKNCVEADFAPTGCCFNWLDCSSYSYFGDGIVNQRKYLLAIVWSAGQILTVGAPLSPVTDCELSYQLMTQLCAGILYAYLIGAVCSVFSLKTKSQTQFFEDLDALNDYLVKTKVNMRDRRLCRSLRAFFQFSNTMQDTSTDILSKVSPSLRKQLAWQVHSFWLTRVQLFQDLDLPQEFYVVIASLLESNLFAPGEILIEPHDFPDKLFILHSGMVLAGRIRTVGDPFGEDCMSVWRNNASRNFQATAMSHGRVYTMFHPKLMEVMHRPQYQSTCQQAFKNMTRAKCQSIVRFFHRTIVSAVQHSNDMYQVCRAIRRALMWVKEEAMVTIILMGMRYFSRTKPKEFDDVQKQISTNTGNACSLDTFLLHIVGVQTSAGDFKSKSSTAENEELLRIAKQLRRKIASTGEKMGMIMQVAQCLAKLGLEDHATDLVIDEGVDIGTLLKMSSENLHQCGIPMYQAIAFAEWSQSLNKGSKWKILRSTQDIASRMIKLKGGVRRHPNLNQELSAICTATMKDMLPPEVVPDPPKERDIHDNGVMCSPGSSKALRKLGDDFQLPDDGTYADTMGLPMSADQTDKPMDLGVNGAGGEDFDGQSAKSSSCSLNAAIIPSDADQENGNLSDQDVHDFGAGLPEQSKQTFATDGSVSGMQLEKERNVEDVGETVQGDSICSDLHKLDVSLRHSFKVPDVTLSVVGNTMPYVLHGVSVQDAACGQDAYRFDHVKVALLELAYANIDQLNAKGVSLTDMLEFLIASK